MLCHQTPPKRWFENVNKTLLRDVKNSAHQVKMTASCPLLNRQWTPQQNGCRTPLADTSRVYVKRAVKHQHLYPNYSKSRSSKPFNFRYSFIGRTRSANFVTFQWVCFPGVTRS